MPDPNAFLDAFLALDGDDSSAIEAFRAEHCHWCRTISSPDGPSVTPEQCERSCSIFRCELPWPGQVAKEQAFVREIRAAIPPIPHQPDPAAMHRLNERHLMYGAAVPRMVQTEAGHWHLSTAGATLRGKVHKALTDLARVAAGDLVDLNVGTMGADDVDAKLIAARDSYDAGLWWYAASLRDAGISDNRIAARINRTNAAIRNRLGPRAAWCGTEAWRDSEAQRPRRRRG